MSILSLELETKGDKQGLQHQEARQAYASRASARSIDWPAFCLHYGPTIDLTNLNLLKRRRR
ncbi:MAG: hypothetical protein JRJ77_10030 [Deltaproteobacteria bacterium]|nr:hypothetical protein [Deltaproteobacteria bacterium]